MSGSPSCLLFPDLILILLKHFLSFLLRVLKKRLLQELKSSLLLKQEDKSLLVLVSSLNFFLLSGYLNLNMSFLILLSFLRKAILNLLNRILWSLCTTLILSFVLIYRASTSVRASYVNDIHSLQWKRLQ